jgi:hypothetical protein
VVRGALVFMANDRYYRWALTFLESVRERNPRLPLYWIPYDEYATKIGSLSVAFDFERIEADFSALDAFADRLFPSRPMKRANLRKYAALQLQYDEIAYFDVDSVVLVDPERLFGHVQPGVVDLVYLSTSPDFVYRKDRLAAARAHFPNMSLMSAGAFVTSRRALSIGEMIATAESHYELFQSLRRRGSLYDQPLLNFVLDRAGKICKHISDLDSGLAGMVSFRSSQIGFQNHQVVETSSGRDVVAVHWAGAFKTGLEAFNPRYWPLGALRSGFLKRGRARAARTAAPAH